MFLYFEIERGSAGAAVFSYFQPFIVWLDGSYFIPFISYNYNMMLLFGKNELAVMATYRRTCRFNMFVHLLGLLAIHGVISSTYSIFMTLQQSEWTAYKVRLHTNFRKVVLDGRADF